MSVAPAEFQFISALVHKRSGIVLEAGKEYLVEARLGALVRQEKLDSMGALVALLRAEPASALVQRVVEAMTTNETSFFRDAHPFEALRRVVVPAAMEARKAEKALSIWCAASSTGQEPYTIAMTLKEHFPALAGWKVTFIATDISAEMIRRSREGKYGQIEVNRGLPAALMVKYFKKQGLEWQIDASLRSMIDFREMNLTTAWTPMPPMDIVFMRNVLIYFDQATKKDIFGRIRRLMRPDGYLFLGCAETTMSLDDAFERVQVERSGCYRLRQAAAPARAA
jgi:chemotaxis protein methyltransferase CheR